MQEMMTGSLQHASTVDVPTIKVRPQDLCCGLSVSCKILPTTKVGVSMPVVEFAFYFCAYQYLCGVIIRLPC
jgi:hypothetical protein